MDLCPTAQYAKFAVNWVIFVSDLIHNTVFQIMLSSEKFALGSHIDSKYAIQTLF